MVQKNDQDSDLHNKFNSRNIEIEIFAGFYARQAKIYCKINEYRSRRLKKLPL